MIRFAPSLVLRHCRPAGVALAWRQLLARPLRFAAAVSGIAFASLMMLMQLGFRDALYDSVCLFHQALDGELVLISSDYDYLADPRTLPRRRLTQALALPGVEAAGGFLEFGHFSALGGGGVCGGATRRRSGSFVLDC